MRKKKTKHVMWALWNFGRIMGVKHGKKGAREYADYLHDPESTAAMFKSGAFRISKVTVTEI